MSDRIEWTGDLNDDCVAKWRGMTAHCEVISDYVGDDNELVDLWWCAVDREDDGEDLFDSGLHGGYVTSGDLARAICEAVMRAHAVEKP